MLTSARLPSRRLFLGCRSPTRTCRRRSRPWWQQAGYRRHRKPEPLTVTMVVGGPSPGEMVRAGDALCCAKQAVRESRRIASGLVILGPSSANGGMDLLCTRGQGAVVVPRDSQRFRKNEAILG